MKKIFWALSVLSIAFTASCSQSSKADGPGDKSDDKDVVVKDEGEQLAYRPEVIEAKGTLVIEGGGDRIAPILNKIIEKGGGPEKCKLMVIPFASQVPDTGERQAAEFRALGCKNADFIMCPKDVLDDPKTLAKLDGVTAIFFSGGDQSRLKDYIGGTQFFYKIKSIYENGGVIGGTSAGAAIMSRIMLTGRAVNEGPDDESPTFNEIKSNWVETKEGFGFLDNIIVDQHFIARRRQVRLINVLMDNPGYRGIGIDEECAVVVNPDNTIEIVGTGCAMLFEPYKKGSDGSNAHSFKLTVLYPGDKHNI